MLGKLFAGQAQTIAEKSVGKQEASQKHTIGMLLTAIESIIKGVGKSVDAQGVGKALICICSMGKC